MEVKKLVCDVCGGQIEMQSGGKGICTSCGTPYSAEIIKDKIQEIRGTVHIDGPVEIIKGSSEIKRLLENIKNLISAQQYESALKQLNKFMEEYPTEVEGYILRLQLHTKLGKYLYKDTLGEYHLYDFADKLLEYIDKDFSSILSLDTNYLDYAKEVIKEFCDNIWIGKSVFSNFLYALNEQNYKNEDIRKMIRQGIVNAEKMNYIKAYYHRPVGYKFCLGKSVLFYSYGDSYDDGGEYIKVASDLEGAMRQENQRRKSEGICQHCCGHFKGVFNKVCRGCGKPKDY